MHAPGGELLAGDAGDRGTGPPRSPRRWRPVARVHHDGRYVAVAQAGTEHVATLVLDPGGAELGQPERRTLERGAVVTALVMLLARTVAETEDRLGGELLGDLLDARPEALPALRERARRRQRLARRRRWRSRSPPSRGCERFAAQPGSLARVASEQRGLAGDHLGRPVLLVPGDDPRAVGRRAGRRGGRAAGGRATVGVVRAPTPTGSPRRTPRRGAASTPC